MASDKVSAPGLVLDLPSFQLLRDGLPVKLEKNPMELLTLLVRRRGALVSPGRNCRADLGSVGACRRRGRHQHSHPKNSASPGR